MKHQPARRRPHARPGDAHAHRPAAGPSSTKSRPHRPPPVKGVAGSPDEGAKPPAPATIASGVQTVAVTADESGMRVDRFFEARFPGLSFSHIQRIIRKGEVRVNGKRTQPKNRLEAGQAVRIPPLTLG